VLGTIAGLTEQLARYSVPSQVVRWASPVPYFGKIASARVATVGINPSNLEFVNTLGQPLAESDRRLETLDSLQLSEWKEANGQTVRALARAYEGYFRANPYRRWFDVLERILAVSGHSYYGEGTAAHLDLVPFATMVKWSDLPHPERRALIAEGRKAMAESVALSSLEVLVLNGRSVVEAFVASTDSALSATAVSHLSLPRVGGRSIQGFRWDGTITNIGGYDLGRAVRVVGFNHNVQSSFGVTKRVMEGIGMEIGDVYA